MGSRRKEVKFAIVHDICLSFQLLFAALITVYAELELEESMTEMMTGHEVHEGGDLV